MVESTGAGGSGFFRFFPKQWCTMILIEIGQYRKMPQVDSQYRPLLGLKFGSVVIITIKFTLVLVAFASNYRQFFFHLFTVVYMILKKLIKIIAKACPLPFSCSFP